MKNPKSGHTNSKKNSKSQSTTSADTEKSTAQNKSKAPYTQFSLVLEYYSTNLQLLIEEAFMIFLDEVDPSPEKLDEERLSMFFSEWFVFDYVLPSQKTVLNNYVSVNPDKLSDSECDSLSQAAKSNFCSEFWIESVDKDQYLLRLEEISSGTIFEVYDKSASTSIASNAGMIGARLINIDGMWYLAGNPPYYYPIKPTINMKDELRKAGQGVRLSFIELVQRVFSDDTNDVIDFELRSLEDLDDEEAAALLEEVKKEYNRLRKKYSLPIKWQQIKNCIHYVDSTKSPSEVFKTLFTQSGTIDPGFEDEELFSQVIELFLEAWNLLPHYSLGNKSPLQVRKDVAEVDLTMLIQALEKSPDSSFAYYIDKDTMEVSFVDEELFTFLEDYMFEHGSSSVSNEKVEKTLTNNSYDFIADYEYKELLKWLSGYEDKIIFINPLSVHKKYEIMIDYIDEMILDRDVALQLEKSTRGKGAFRKFKDLLNQYGYLDEYYEYYGSVMQQHALDWLEENDFIIM